MKVLYWSASFPPNLGGLEVISGEFVSAVRQRGVQMAVVTNGPGPDHWHDVPVHRFRLIDMTIDSDFFRVAEVRARIRRIIRDFQPELVHVNGIGGSLPMLLLCLPPELPYVVTLHGSWGKHRPREVGRLFWHADWVAACSVHTLQVAREFDPALAACSSVILNALPEPPQTGSSARGDYLLCSGRLSEEKGFDIAVRALAGLPRVRLRIAGEGQERAALQALCRELGVQSRVDFLGVLDKPELVREMRGALALLCPSLLEGFGLVALEAAQVGTPVVAARIGGLPEVVGDTGVLVDSHDPAEWTAAIEALLASGKVDDLGQRAQERAARLFSWDGYVDSYMGLYRLVLRQEGRCRRDVLQARYEMWCQGPERRSEASFQIGGAAVLVRCEGKELLQTWSRLWVPGPAESKPELTVDVAFAVEPTTGYVEAPDLTRRWRHMGAASNLEEPVLACERPGVASLYHRANRHLAVRIDPAANLLPSDVGKPLLVALLRWLNDRGVQAYHAAVVARGDRGVLLAGGENAGKSTVLLSCLQAGWEFVADDIVLLHKGLVEGLYGSTWIARDHAKRCFPDLLPHLHSSPLEPKSLLFVDDIRARRLSRVKVAAAVLVERVDDVESRVVAWPREPLVQAALAGSYCLNPGRVELENLLRSASSWKLELGGGIAALPALVAQLLDR